MARDLGKLWFEMGVRDDVTKTLKGITEELMQVEDGIERMKRKMENDLTRSLYRLREVAERTQQAISKGMSLGLDTNKLQEGLRKMQEYERKLMDLRNMPASKLNRGTIASLTGAEFEAMIRNMRRMTIAQEGLNRTRERGTQQVLRQEVVMQERLVAAYDKATGAINRQGKAMGQLRNIVNDYLSVYAGVNLLRGLITTGGEFETQRIALQTILGDPRQGQDIYSQIQSLAIESPMGFRELAGYTKQLAAFNVPYEELYDTTKRLADISAGVGVDMGRLILAYGQVRSASVLRGSELRQFTEAGIPMVEALAEKFTKLKGEVVTSGDVLGKLIPTRQVPFEMVKEVLEEMTDEGGRFYNMQFVLADTLAGKWSNLRDAWEVMLSGIADGRTLTGEFLKEAVGGLTALIKNMDTLLPLITAVGLGWGMKRAANWAGNNFNFGLGGVNAALLNAKELEAQRLTRKALVEGADTLTAREKELLATRRELTAYDYKMIAASGRLNTLQLSRLYRSGQINARTLVELKNMQAITREQAKQIMQGGRLAGIQSALRSAVGGVGSMLMGMVKDPFMWLTAIMAGTGAIISHYEQVSQQAEQAMDGITQRSQQLREEVNNLLGAGKPTDDDMLAGRVEEMLEALKGVVPNYNEIRAEADSIQNLGDKYDYLAQKLKLTAEAYKSLSDEGTGDLMEDMTNAAGGGILGFFSGNGEGLGTDMEQYDDAARELTKYATELNKHVGDEVMEAINKIAEGNTKLKQALQGQEGLTNILLTFFKNTSEAEQIRLQRFVPSVIDYRSGFNDMKDKLQEMYRDMDAAVETYMDEKRAKGWNFGNLTDSQKMEVQQFFDNWIASYEEGSKEAKRLVEQYGLNKMNIKLTVDIDTSEAETQLSGFAQQVWQHFGGSVVKPGGSITIGGNDYTAEQVKQNFKDASSTRKSMAQAVKDAYQEWKDLKDLSVVSQDMKDEAYKKYRNAVSAYNAMGWTGDPATDGKKKGGAKKKDTWLEQMNDRLKLLRTYISTYKKLRDAEGRAQAIEAVNSASQFAPLRQIGITDPEDEVGAIRKIEALLAKNNTTADRRKKLEEVRLQLYDAQTEAIVRQNRILNETSAKQLETMQKQWDMYKRWLDATGDTGIAGTVAFGGHTDYENIAEQLRDEVARLLEERNKANGANEPNTPWTVEGVLGMTGTELDEAFGKTGQDADGLRERIDALREAEQKLSEETLNGLLEMIEASKGYEAQLADIDRELGKQIELINKTTFSEDADESERIKAQYRQDATDAADRKRSEVLFKKFQEESDWVTIFDDLDRVSTATITGMIDKIEEFSRTAGLSVEDVKKLRDALDKLRQENLERNPFGGLAEAVGRANAIREILNNWPNGTNGPNAPMVISEAEAKRAGLQAGKYSKAELENLLKGAEDDVVRSMEGIGKAFDELRNVLSPLIDMFDALGIGMEGVGDVLDTIGGALGTASSTGSSLSNLMGMSVGENKTLGDALGIKNAGMWGAIAGAALSVTTSIFQLHDKALQKEIEASEARQKEMENLVSGMERVLERVMGGVYKYEASEADLDELSKYLERRESGSYKYGYIQDETREQIKEAENSRSYYDAYLASLMAQRDELAHQMDAERDKKKSDKDKLEDMQSQYDELDDQIRHFAEDMAEELYNIDFKGWASDLAQTLTDAWASGADAAEAYRKKVSEILRDVGVSILTQKYIEPLLEEEMEKFMDWFEANNGVMNEEGIDILAGIYDKGEKAAEIVGAYLDGLEQVANEHGDTLKDTESSSSSVISGNISEDEFGLMVAYVNSIRADVSLERTCIQRMVEETMPGITNALAQHTAALKAIEANTKRGADAAVGLTNLMESVAAGTKKLNVVTWVKKN